MWQKEQKEEIVFFDTEISGSGDKASIEDIGAIRGVCPVLVADGIRFHSKSTGEFERFLQGAAYIAGHNIIDFDLKYTISIVQAAKISSVIDTLWLSPLLFPEKPYHRLLKDDKLQTEELNNPLNDSLKSMELFLDEVSAFENLSHPMKRIFSTLLCCEPGFMGFFRYINFQERSFKLSEDIISQFSGSICENVKLEGWIKDAPIELAYCLATISTKDKDSIIPGWVQKKYPRVHDVYRALRGVVCKEGCPYCGKALNIHAKLKEKFGYDNFRVYEGEPLQEKAVAAAVDGKSLLAIFPTGGGKSITFQLPALMAADAVHGLTVVISPLQSLMKDQVDNLSKRGVTDAVTINGLLNVVERAEALERVESGIASILYISPESLRSKTIERLLLGRNIVRFVIDEAHCFSSWGQDFRVDYLYIGDFIASLQEKKQVEIPVSCFTATAKQKVVSDIKEYFKQKLNLELELFTTNAARSNLQYEVLYRENDTEKYTTLRNLIKEGCPTIVYASRTKRTMELAEKLCNDGFNARAFHGKMSSDEKVSNQEAFIRGDVQIIVATSAFGMGVDKKDVGMVVHYDISDSLENYVQEAGRAGRDENIQAKCYVLFNENDLDKHFLLLNQTKLSINEIQQIWKGVKELTRGRGRICCSALELARSAGWDENVTDVETKVKTAISALEVSGYLKRGQNCPRVFADSIQVKNVTEASDRINNSNKFDEKQKEIAIRIIKKLISTRSRAKADTAEAESRVDYIAEHLGLEKPVVIESINLMKEEGILASDKEMSVYVDWSYLRGNAKNSILSKFLALEGFLFEQLRSEEARINYKAVNEEALNRGIKVSTVNNIRILLYFWIIKGYIRKPEGELNTSMLLSPCEDIEVLKNKYKRRMEISVFIEKYFINKARENSTVSENTDNILVNFSIQELQRAYDDEPRFEPSKPATLKEMEETLLYLSKINAFRLEGGFLVLYNAMEIKRLETDNKRRYKVEDYKQLKEFYDIRTQQIHIVGEYANMMVQDYDAALAFVNDYFRMEYKLFLTKYFAGARLSEIGRNITPMKYKMLFESLSAKQAEIINDDKSKAIVVAAGPGSGKTKILVHKLASLMLLEDVKHEQLLMLTFSRAAAMEFKSRLIELIGNAAYFIEIKTFHSYCFDLLGKIGNIENSKNVVKDAAEMIRRGEAELDRITKTVLVLDEAQDMDEAEFDLVNALMERNEEMRVIAVGDDDQNIYEFRGSDSRYMASILNMPEAVKYELLENFRSSKTIVDFSNAYVKTIKKRMKVNDIIAVRKDLGEVMVLRVNSSLEMSIANLLMGVVRTTSGKSIAVLTGTNEQAYLIASILNKRNINARLIQSNDGFSLCDLAELRYFIRLIKINNAPIITDDVWNKAKEELQKDYAESANIKACMYLIEQYEKVNEKKYYTDFEAYLRESRFEDFYTCSQGEICVSTIHKSKGREFDYVYMLLDGYNRTGDEQRRSIYVGMTRAKEKLCIAYSDKINCFEDIRWRPDLSHIRWCMDKNIYQTPEEILMPLSHRDIWLDYQVSGQAARVIEQLRSGARLAVAKEGNGDNTKIIFIAEQAGNRYKLAVTSKKFYGELSKQEARGYEISSAKLFFVVEWKNKDTGAVHDIILPMLRMKKRH